MRRVLSAIVLPKPTNNSLRSRWKITPGSPYCDSQGKPLATVAFYTQRIKTHNLSVKIMPMIRAISRYTPKYIYMRNDRAWTRFLATSETTKLLRITVPSLQEARTRRTQKNEMPATMQTRVSAELPAALRHAPFLGFVPAVL
jgi:hypothetical protein